mgnify:FL=1
MDELNYFESKELACESLKDYINNEGFNDEQALAATLEDSIILMKNNKVLYIAVIQSLAIQALNKKIIPDYILEKIKEISSLDNDFLRGDDKKEFIKDNDEIKLKLEQHDFCILEDEAYKMRINMLLN